MTLAVREVSMLALVVALWWIAKRSAVGHAFPFGDPPRHLWALSAAAAFLVAGPAAIVAVAATFVAAVVDARTGYIPNPLIATAAAAVIVLQWAAVHEAEALAGGAACGALLLGLVVLTRGRGLGLGDVKLGTTIGLALGPLEGPTALATAFVTGGVYGCWLLATGRARRDDAVRFGPFLAVGASAAAVVFRGMAS
jgi:leader peptidase (prepilin peptidase)/N-methyltransferase